MNGASEPQTQPAEYTRYTACRYCGSGISEQAKACRGCGRWQNRLHEHLFQGINLVSIGLLIFAGVQSWKANQAYERTRALAIVLAKNGAAMVSHMGWWEWNPVKDVRKPLWASTLSAASELLEESGEDPMSIHQVRVLKALLDCADEIGLSRGTDEWVLEQTKKCSRPAGM